MGIISYIQLNNRYYRPSTLSSVFPLHNLIKKPQQLKHSVPSVQPSEDLPKYHVWFCKLKLHKDQEWRVMALVRSM